MSWPALPNPGSRAMADNSVISFYKNLTPLRKMLLGFAVTVVLGGAFWYFVLGPKIAKVEQLKKDISQIEANIAAYRIAALKLPAVEKEFEKNKRIFLLASALLPEDTQALETLLASFEKLGKDEGVDFLLFSPGNETQQDFYASRTVSLRIQGQFHNVLRYLDRLSHLDRLVTVSKLVLQPQQKDDGVHIVADTSLLVYRSLSEAEIKAREEAKKGKKKK